MRNSWVNCTKSKSKHISLKQIYTCVSFCTIDKKMKYLTTVNLTGTSIYFYYGYRNRPVLYKLLIIGMFYEFVHNFQAIILKLDPLELCQILLYRLDTPTNYRQSMTRRWNTYWWKGCWKFQKWYEDGES